MQGEKSDAYVNRPTDTSGCRVYILWPWLALDDVSVDDSLGRLGHKLTHQTNPVGQAVFLNV